MGVHATRNWLPPLAILWKPVQTCPWSAGLDYAHVRPRTRTSIQPNSLAVGVTETSNHAAADSGAARYHQTLNSAARIDICGIQPRLGCARPTASA